MHFNMVLGTGFEPVISGVKGQRPRPLDEPSIDSTIFKEQLDFSINTCSITQSEDLSTTIVANKQHGQE